MWVASIVPMTNSRLAIAPLLILLSACEPAPETEVMQASLTKKDALEGTWLMPSEQGERVVSFVIGERTVDVIDANDPGAEPLTVVGVQGHLDIVRCFSQTDEYCGVDLDLIEETGCQPANDSARPWQEREYVDATWPEGLLESLRPTEEDRASPAADSVTLCMTL